MNTTTNAIACDWTCACGYHGSFHLRPMWGDEKYLLDEVICFPCYRRRYVSIMDRWAHPMPAFADAAGVVTAPGRPLLAEHVESLVEHPDRNILKLAISVAHVVVARAVVDTLELTFDLGGLPQAVIVGAPLPHSFVRDLAAVVATEFAPLQRKARG